MSLQGFGYDDVVHQFENRYKIKTVFCSYGTKPLIYSGLTQVGYIGYCQLGNCQLLKLVVFSDIYYFEDILSSHNKRRKCLKR